MSENTRKVRLLLVDDEQEFLESSARALGRRGFEVHTAADGVKALEMVTQHDFDVVVLDLKMPGMSGEEVFNRINKDLPSIPVMILTGHGSVPHAFKISKKGIADYIAKPCDMNELAGRIYETVGLAKQRDDALTDETTASLASVIEVLLVDDEVELLKSLRSVLQRRNMNVTVAEDAGQALDCLRKTLVEVAIVDVKMPGMDGLGLLRIIRQDFPTVKVILLSGYPSAAAALEGIRQGASEYLRKPPDVVNLVATIRRLRRQREEDVAERQRQLIEEIRRRYPE